MKPTNATYGGIGCLFLGFFMLPGLGLLIAAGIFAKERFEFLETAQQSEGIVMELRRSGDSYVPVVEYETPEGGRYSIEGDVASNPPAFKRGERVTIYYNPSDPEQAMLGGFMGMWFGPFIMGIMGIFFFLMAGIPAVIMRKFKRHLPVPAGGGRAPNATTPSLPSTRAPTSPAAQSPPSQDIAPHHRTVLRQFLRSGDKKGARQYAAEQCGLSGSQAEQLFKELD